MGPQATDPVNVDSTARQIAERYLDNATPNIFDIAQQQVRKFYYFYLSVLFIWGFRWGGRVYLNSVLSVGSPVWKHLTKIWHMRITFLVCFFYLLFYCLIKFELFIANISQQIGISFLFRFISLYFFFQKTKYTVFQ